MCSLRVSPSQSSTTARKGPRHFRLLFPLKSNELNSTNLAKVGRPLAGCIALLNYPLEPVPHHSLLLLLPACLLIPLILPVPNPTHPTLLDQVTILLSVQSAIFLQLTNFHGTVDISGRGRRRVAAASYGFGLANIIFSHLSHIRRSPFHTYIFVCPSVTVVRLSTLANPFRLSMYPWDGRQERQANR